ncbi:MAG TPA: glycosyltransferase [Candidatus Acidoferrales bacterium]|jgi:glycosyltransferase involved in cell wall biosynthesis|nr:glycosyltransferase [Candidatus Acidoferrales bacterium]
MPHISAIIPARNEEENIGACVASLAAQPEIGEIIVVNDQSTDRTGEILARLSQTVRRLKILESTSLPAGWIGKNHAVWLGAQQANCEWLLFTDADTAHLPGAAHRALEDARVHDAALVSYSPEQITRSIAERALIPFIYCRLSRKFDFARVNDPSLPDAAANGQFLMIRRDAYETIGGHRAVADAVLEDVALARRAKQAGFRLHFASGQGIAQTRMYRSFTAMWQGWTKNLYLLLGGTRKGVLRELVLAFPWPVIFLIAAGIIVRGREGLWLDAFGILWLAGCHIAYGRELHRNRYSARFIIYYVPGVCLYAAVVIASGWKYWRGKVLWKGREYPVGKL